MEIYARHFEKNLNNKKRLDQTIANIMKLDKKKKILCFRFFIRVETAQPSVSAFLRRKE